MEKLTRILEDCTLEEREAAMLLFKAAENREQRKEGERRKEKWIP